MKSDYIDLITEIGMALNCRREELEKAKGRCKEKERKEYWDEKLERNELANEFRLGILPILHREAQKFLVSKGETTNG